MITTPEIKDKNAWFYTYNGVIHANTIDETWNQYVDKEINNELLLAYGYGDGGGGVTREMLEMIPRLNKMPSLPNVKSQKAGEFFDGLHKRIDQSTQYVHEWDGELYLEYHRGTYTTQAKIKKYNRVLENYYRFVEMISVLKYLVKGNWLHFNQENK